jgi:hypothetical protein
MKVNVVMQWLLIGAALLAWSGVSTASRGAEYAASPPAKATAKQSPGAKPTLADVPHGSHPNQVLDLECYLAYPGAPNLKYGGTTEFLIAKLKGPAEHVDLLPRPSRLTIGLQYESYWFQRRRRG